MEVSHAVPPPMTRRTSLPDLGLLVVRVGLGFSLMFHHGADKLFGGPAVWTEIGSVLRMFGLHHGHTWFGFAAAFTEFIGGGLLVLGLCMRPALGLLIGTMSVAAMAHAVGVVPGSMAYALDLAIVFVGLFLLGPGRYSFDAHLLACAPQTFEPASHLWHKEVESV